MLTQFKTDSKDLSLLQTSWANDINPVLAQPFNSGIFMKNLNLGVGTNTIITRLSRKLQGWIIVGMHGAYAQVYDLQNSNQMPDKTLLLVSSAQTNIDLFIF